MSYHDDTTPEAHNVLPEKREDPVTRTRFNLTRLGEAKVVMSVAQLVVLGGFLASLCWIVYRVESFYQDTIAFEDNVLHRLIVIEHHLQIPDHESQAPMPGPVSMKGQP